MSSRLKSTSNPLYTLAEGCPIGDLATAFRLNQPSLGTGGLMLLQDTQLIETLAHFARERIPERVVHAKAAGAYGTFTVTHDISDITSAKFLNSIGKETPVLVRISTVGPEAGSADTVRDVRGWGIKFYTEEGNQDWFFNNIRHPQTHLPDSTMFWDFHNNNQEGIHTLMHLFSDRATPASLRNTHAFSGHTYKFTKEDGSFKYVKIHIKTDQGIKNFSEAEATKVAGESPDHNIQDLFEAIEKKDFPSWTCYVQVMDPKDTEKYKWNIFDMTKPQNYFTDIEMAAFSPSIMVPGIAPSADPMLQARMFSYPDAARYRLGVNYQQLPTNYPVSPVYSPFQRDGAANFRGNYGPDPNYVRTSFRKMEYGAGIGKGPHDEWIGKVATYSSEVQDVYFEHATTCWVMYGKTRQQDTFVKNVAGHLGGAVPEVQAETFKMFARVDFNLAKRIEDAIKK